MLIQVCFQDFTGVPAVVDLACMRDAMNNLGSDSSKINPLVCRVLNIVLHPIVRIVFALSFALVCIILMTFCIHAGSRRSCY